MDSILGQTLGDLEVIAIDDASTDCSASILKSYRADERVRLIIHRLNRGRVYTTNEGISLAKGRYVHVGESDDYCDRRFLQMTCDVLDRHPKVGLVHAHVEAVDASGNCLLDPRTLWDAGIQKHLSADYVNAGLDEFRLLIRANNYIRTLSGVVFRREVFDHVGGFDRRFPICSDWHKYLQTALHYDVAYIDEVRVYHRRHEGSFSLGWGGAPTAFWRRYLIEENVFRQASGLLENWQAARQEQRARTRRRLLDCFEVAYARGRSADMAGLLWPMLRYDLLGALASPRILALWALALLHPRLPAAVGSLYRRARRRHAHD